MKRVKCPENAKLWGGAPAPGAPPSYAMQRSPDDVRIPSVALSKITLDVTEIETPSPKLCKREAWNSHKPQRNYQNAALRNFCYNSIMPTLINKAIIRFPIQQTRTLLLFLAQSHCIVVTRPHKGVWVPKVSLSKITLNITEMETPSPTRTLRQIPNVLSQHNSTPEIRPPLY